MMIPRLLARETLAGEDTTQLVTIGKFCLTVGPLTGTAGILTQSVKGAGC